MAHSAHSQPNDICSAEETFQTRSRSQASTSLKSVHLRHTPSHLVCTIDPPVRHPPAPSSAHHVSPSICRRRFVCRQPVSPSDISQFIRVSCPSRAPMLPSASAGGRDLYMSCCGGGRCSYRAPELAARAEPPPPSQCAASALVRERSQVRAGELLWADAGPGGGGLDWREENRREFGDTAGWRAQTWVVSEAQRLVARWPRPRVPGRLIAALGDEVTHNYRHSPAKANF